MIRASDGDTLLSLADAVTIACRHLVDVVNCGFVVTASFRPAIQHLERNEQLSMNTYMRGLAAAALAASSLTLAVGSSSADVQPIASAPAPTVIQDSGSRKTTFVDPECISKGLSTKDCTVNEVVTVSAPEVVTPEAAGISRMSAVAASTIYVKSIHQYMQGVTWKETHTAKFYYNGQVAWTGSYKGYKGNHDCDNGYAVGYEIQILTCTAARGPAKGFDLIDKIKVKSGIGSVAVSFTHSMTMHPNGNGPVTFS